MACKTVSVLGAATQQVAIPSRLPQTQSDWQAVVQQLNSLFSQLSTTARRPAATSVPIQYATLFSSTLPPLQTTNCTVTADNSWSLFGGYSYRIAVTGSNASVVCGASGFPLPIPPNENWLLSVYGKCSGASQSFKMGLQTATTTYENTVITDATATAVDRFAIPLNLVADDASQCTLRLDFPSASGQTFWFDGFQYEPSVTGSINPSPFLSTNIIAGSIVAQFITVAQLSALSANMGTLTAGKIQSSDGRFTIDCTNELITITDGTNTRMQIGEVSAGVYDVKIWNGSGTLLFDAATGLQYAGNSTQVTQVIANNAGNGQLNANPTGGVTGNLPHSNQSTQTQQVIANVGGNGQLNVNPTGGVTSTLPQANHDPTVLLSSVTGNQRNLIPDSGLKNVKAYWTDHSSGLITVTQNLDGNTNCFQYVGTGSPSSYQYQASKIITITPGTYTLSAKGWVGNITTGSMFIGVYNTAITTSYGALTLTATRASTTITIPSGVSQVVVIFDTNNATVANGKGAGVQDMQFEPGSVMTAYRENTGDNLSGTLLIDTGNSNHIGNWQHSYMSTGVKGVISSGSQLTVNPTGGVAGTLPYLNHDVSFRNVISSGSQVNVNPTGGVTGNLPYANHDASVRTTLASTAGGDGSYLNTGQVFNRHLNSANQAGLADDPAGNYLRWTGNQQKGFLTNHGPNHIADPSFQTLNAAVGPLWFGSGVTASNGVLNLGTAAASTYYDCFQYDGHGNPILNPCYPGDTLVLQLTWTQAQTGTANTYLVVQFANNAQVLQSSYGSVQSSITGTYTAVVTVPANMYFFRVYLETYGGASGGNSALVTNPQIRVNHETVADASGKKAYIDFTDNTSGGHVGKHLGNVPDDSGSNRYAVAAVDPNKKALIDYSQPGHANANLQYFGGIQSGYCYDGQAITFNPTYASVPLVFFPANGMTYSSGVGSATSQSLAFTASSLTASGFTASLKLVTGGTLTARSDNFSTVTAGSEYNATLTNAPAYDNQYTVNWTLSLGSSSAGTVEIRETNSTGTLLSSHNYINGQNGAKATGVTWSGATGTSVIDISLTVTQGTGTISASTVTFTSGTAPSTNSAVPSTAPILWIALPQT